MSLVYALLQEQEPEQEPEQPEELQQEAAKEKEKEDRESAASAGLQQIQKMQQMMQPRGSSQRSPITPREPEPEPEPEPEFGATTQFEPEPEPEPEPEFEEPQQAATQRRSIMGLMSSPAPAPATARTPTPTAASAAGIEVRSWHDWSPAEVSSWLCASGLQKYAGSFEEQAVDGMMLEFLDGDALSELGVKSGLDRARLLGARGRLPVRKDKDDEAEELVRQLQQAREAEAAAVARAAETAEQAADSSAALGQFMQEQYAQYGDEQQQLASDHNASAQLAGGDPSGFWNQGQQQIGAGVGLHGDDDSQYYQQGDGLTVNVDDNGEEHGDLDDSAIALPDVSNLTDADLSVSQKLRGCWLLLPRQALCDSGRLYLIPCLYPPHLSCLC